LLYFASKRSERLISSCHSNANNKQPANEKSQGEESDDVSTPANVRIFASEDPLVADLANKIEIRYPGHVVGVNRKIRDTRGKIVTEIDIELQNANIQVKSGGGKGLTRQVIQTQAISDNNCFWSKFGCPRSNKCCKTRSVGNDR